MKITDSDFKAAGQSVLDALGANAPVQPGWSVLPDNQEGVRVSLDKPHGDGWFLLRLSLHDPILPLNMASDSAGGCEQIYDVMKEFLAGYPELEL